MKISEKIAALDATRADVVAKRAALQAAIEAGQAEQDKAAKAVITRADPDDEAIDVDGAWVHPERAEVYVREGDDLVIKRKLV